MKWVHVFNGCWGGTLAGIALNAHLWLVLAWGLAVWSFSFYRLTHPSEPKDGSS